MKKIFTPPRPLNRFQLFFILTIRQNVMEKIIGSDLNKIHCISDTKHWSSVINLLIRCMKQSFIGILMFLGGMYINIRSDVILTRLKDQSEGTYKIPRGGSD